MMKCEVCGNHYVRSCMKCYKRISTWGIDGTVALIEMAKRSDDIDASEYMSFVDKYYIGKATIRSDKANVVRTALRVLGYKGNFVGRVHKNQTDYISIRKREHSTGRRWQLLQNNCKWCNSSEKLRLHHIVPIAWGGLTSEENCITLCQKCHEEAHKKLSKTLNRTLLLSYLEPHKEEIERLAKL